MEYDIAIVGGGIAGYTAALTAKNLKLNYLWFAPDPFGNKIRKAETVRNFPSFQGDGAAFFYALSAQCNAEGVSSVGKRVDGIYRFKEGFTLTSGSEQFKSKTVVIATGVSQRSVTGEEAFLGRGVSYCAVCDGALYRGKKIACVLYDKEFCDEVEYLASFASEVVCICPFDYTFRAANIKHLKTTVTGVEGGLRVERVVTKEGSISVDGVFFLLSATPPAALCGGLKCDGAHIIVNRTGATNLAGLFAAGDITGRPYQYAKAAGEGLVCAYSASDYLKAMRENLLKTDSV